MRSREQPARDLLGSLSVHSPAMPRHDLFHRQADVLRSREALFPDHLANRSLDLLVAPTAGKVPLDDPELLFLGAHEVLPRAARVLLDRIAPLLDGAPKNGLDLLVRQLPLSLDLLVLQG